MMSKMFVLLLMLFCHIIDDYFLQGILASMKQKDWWKKNAPQALYKYDYIVALIMHSFSWSFLIMLPIAIYYNFDIDIVFVFVLVINCSVHAVVDNEKANEKTINLVIDQVLHLLQVVGAYIAMIIR